MHYWIMPVTEDNWLVIRDKLVHGVRARNARFCTENIKIGDYLIFYVKKSRSRELGSCFVGVFEVVSNWFKEDKPLWPDEKNEVKYPFRVKLKPVVIGKVNVKEMIDELGFIEKKDIWYVYFQGTPANFKRPIPEKDAELIIERLRGSEGSAQKSDHKHVVECLKEIGNLFGYRVETEFEDPQHLYRYDVGWFREAAVVPSKIFEIVDSNTIDKALARLKHAYDVWQKHDGLYIVVTDVHNLKRVNKLIEHSLTGAFHELKGIVKPLIASEVIELHKFITKYGHIVKELMH